MLSLDEFAHNSSTTQHEYQTEPFFPLQTLYTTYVRYDSFKVNSIIQFSWLFFASNAFSSKYSRFGPTKNKHTEHKGPVHSSIHLFHLKLQSSSFILITKWSHYAQSAHTKSPFIIITQRDNVQNGCSVHKKPFYY